MPTPQTENSALFKPLQLGDITLGHRLVLAPLTRWRASTAPTHVPLPMVATHYTQRAIVPGTLLISEATFISPQAVGQPFAPGIWTRPQIAAWRAVTDAVHAQGSYIYCQLWHNGRAVFAQSEKLHGLAPVSASALSYDGQMGSVAREMSEEDIWQAVREYATAARNAVAAGFDGVEIHAANGYLVDQFIQDVSNHRRDAWSGSVAKRARFALQVTKAVCEAIGPARTGVRLSPLSAAQGMRMRDDAAIRAQFEYVIRGLRDLGIVYLHLIEARVQGTVDSREREAETLDWAVDAFQGGDTSRVVLLAGGYRGESAMRKVDVERAGESIGIVFGRLWTSNPDLVYRIREGIELRKYERKTFYNQQQERGYIDWDFSDELQRELKGKL